MYQNKNIKSRGSRSTMGVYDDAITRENIMMTQYKEPYPTIRDIIKDKDYDYVSYRIAYPGDKNGEFAGCFSVKNNEIIPLDGDTYCLDELVVASEEWSMPEEQIEKGLTVIVKGTWLSNKE